MKPFIYLDNNATTPVDPEVVKTMQPYLSEHFGNPSSTHRMGALTRQAVEKARQHVAMLIGANPWEIIFTSGGTESNNLAILGIARALKERGRHIITSTVEHPAVSEVCRYLENEGFRITYVPVDHKGKVDPESIKSAIKADTILITIMHANNEVGTIQSISEISKLAKKHQIILHTDAAQSAGKIKVDVNALGVDMLSLAGHKFYAPKGIGALYIRQGVQLDKIFHGADHEQNRRPGTENVLEIVGLGKACEIARNAFQTNQIKLTELRDQLQRRIREAIPATVIHGDLDNRLPNTLSVGFAGIEAQTLLAGMPDIAASAGAACHADEVTVSAVLSAMDVPDEIAMGTIRLSVGKFNTAEEIDRAADDLIAAVKSLSGEIEEVKSGADVVKLTSFTHGLGCACKLRPQDLEKVLKNLPYRPDPRVLIGPETSDDAAVYKIRDDLALVETVDFFTPIVDDPYQFGAIAAANALSDVYAMGAKPIFALNIVGFPVKRLDLSVLQEILRGAHDKADEAGISVLGGHTIEDTEPKYGMVVTGEVHPDHIWTNSNAEKGDVIVLTKPIGTGVFSTAMKRGLLSIDQEQMLFDVMAELNKKASLSLHDFTPHACTDVTGFGLLGHLLEISKGSQMDIELYANEVPVLPGLEELIAAGVVPGGTVNNKSFISPWLNQDQLIPDLVLTSLCDAQTSGGLLVALPEVRALGWMAAMKKQGISHARMIGRVTGKGKGFITIHHKH